MRNRAKCKLCGDILESFHHDDLVSCKCGEISINGGLDKLNCSARSWSNFLRVDDNDREVSVIVKEPNDSKDLPVKNENPKPVESKKDLKLVVEEMIKNIETLPLGAQLSPLNHYDMMSLLFLFKRYLDL